MDTGAKIILVVIPLLIVIAAIVGFIAKGRADR